MLPFYIFYSMFGPQRIGDLIWSAADQRARGFLVGATSGRTTLAGEGLQHQDGSSHLWFATIPNCRAYDPAFAYELGVIVERGMEELLTEQRDCFYYLTVTNASYAQPSLPMYPGIRGGILKGMYRLRSHVGNGQVQLLGSGAIMTEVLAASDLLRRDWNIEADVWSVTSYTELHRDGISCEREGRLHPLSVAPKCFVANVLKNAQGPVIAVSDYVRALPELIRAYVPRQYVTLGADGFGRSDTRAELRKFFEVDAISIVIATLYALSKEGQIDAAQVSHALQKYGRNTNGPAPWVR